MKSFVSNLCDRRFFNRTNVEKHTNINQASSDDDGQMFDAHEEIDDIDVEIEVRPHDMKPRLDLSDGSFK